MTIMTTTETQGEAEQWVSAKKALQLLTGTYNGRVAAKAELADLLRDGLVRARATRAWQSSEENISRAWKRPPETPVEENVELAPAVWRRSKWWTEDQGQWRWTNGDFIITRSKEPFKRIMLKRVQFYASDLAKLQNVDAGEFAKGPGGARKRREAWDVMWMELVGIAQAGRLKKSQLESQKNLRAELLPHLDSKEGGLGEDSITPVIRQVWHRFVEKPRPRRPRASS